MSKDNCEHIDGRDWLQETLEELLDACVYLAAKILEIMKGEIK